MRQNNRRGILRGALTALAAVILPAKLAAATRTPGATEGPFYPRPGMRFPDIDNNLVKRAGAVRQAGGEVVRLTGTVRDRGGRPVAGARVEIWQCDVTGRYLHTGDRRAHARDAAFQGFGHMVTGPDGVYRFTTIRPVPYPGRTPHIHVKVFAGGRELTTQFYLADEPGNLRDGLYLRMSKDERRSVEMRFDTGRPVPRAVVDIRL